MRLPVGGLNARQTPFHVRPAYRFTSRLRISPHPTCFVLQVFPYHGGCHANDRAFIVPCMTEPCAGIDTAHVLGRRAVSSTFLVTRGRGDMQTHRHADGSVAALNRECQSLTLMQSLFGHSKSSPAPRSSACIGVAGPRARGAGKNTPGEGSRSRPNFFPASLAFSSDAGPPYMQNPRHPSERAILVAKSDPGGRRAVAPRVRSDMTPLRFPVAQTPVRSRPSPAVMHLAPAFGLLPPLAMPAKRVQDGERARGRALPLRTPLERGCSVCDAKG